MNAKQVLKAHLADAGKQNPDVNCMAEIVSGPQLLVDPKRREVLLQLFPEAIGIDMEGAGETLVTYPRFQAFYGVERRLKSLETILSRVV